MYDQKLDRALTDDDLPPGFKVKELEAFLKQVGLSFVALGDIPTEGSTEWKNDPSVFRASTHTFPSRGRTIKFAEVLPLMEASRALPDIKDPSVAAAVDEAAQTAFEVLSNAISFTEGAEEQIVPQVARVIEAILGGKEYTSRDFPLRRHVRDWPSDSDAETPSYDSPSR
jgi:hypothetical protein